MTDRERELRTCTACGRDVWSSSPTPLCRRCTTHDYRRCMRDPVIFAGMTDAGVDVDEYDDEGAANGRD